MLRVGFRAMGTSMELLLDAPDDPAARGALAAAREEIERLEGLLSRFRPDSELSRLNRARRMRVGPDLARVVSAAALPLRRRTGGRFDPTVGRAMEASGYDRSFEMLADDRAAEGAPVPGGGVVVLDGAWGWAALGPGVDLDLGAIAKGDAATGAEADALATALLIAGARQARRLADAWRVPAVLVDRTGGHRLAGGLR